jgi:hypothetical protein
MGCHVCYCRDCGETISSEWHPGHNHQLNQFCTTTYALCSRCRSSRQGAASLGSAQSRPSSSAEAGEGSSGAGCASLIGLLLAVGAVWYVFDGVWRWLRADFRTRRSTPLYLEPRLSAKSDKSDLEAGTWLVCAGGGPDGCITADSPSGRWVKVSPPFSGDPVWLPYAALSFDRPWYKDAISWLVRFESTDAIDESVRLEQAAALRKRLTAALESGTSEQVDQLIREVKENGLALEGEAQCRYVDGQISSIGALEFEKLDTLVAELKRPPCSREEVPGALAKESELQSAAVTELASEKYISATKMRTACKVGARAKIFDKKQLSTFAVKQLTWALGECNKAGSEANSLARQFQSDECSQFRAVLSEVPSAKTAAAVLTRKCK